MATIREGNRGVLLVVDTQVGVMAEVWDAARVVKNMALAVKRARAAGVPVMWVQHADEEELPHGSPQWQFVPELTPADGETVIHKQFNSAFEQTILDEYLAQAMASHIVLGGASTNWCIRATIYGALERGYDVTLIGDAHSTATMELADRTAIDAQTIIDDLNVTATYLSYPGRTNDVVKAAEVDFRPLGASVVYVGSGRREYRERTG